MWTGRHNTKVIVTIEGKRKKQTTGGQSFFPRVMFVPDPSLAPAEQVKLLSSSFVKLLLLSELNIMLSRLAAEEHFAPKHITNVISDF